MSLLRVYGPGRNWNSFGIVAAGIAEAAKARGLLAGVCFYSQTDSEHNGVEAPVGIVCGDPMGLGLCKFYGHKERILVLAANSSHIPNDTIKAILHHGCTCIWTPSEWSKGQIRTHHALDNVDVYVVPHGVSSVCCKVRDSEWLAGTPLYASLRKPGVSLLHLAESSIDRKGTSELIQAFEPWVGKEDVHLTLVIAPLQVDRVKAIVDDRYEGGASNIRVMGRFNMDPGAISLAYQCFDGVVQPSRAEGFGIVPLEALASGVPALASEATGHLQWMGREEFPGLVCMRVGSEALALYDDIGMAPTVNRTYLRQSLKTLIESNQRLKSEAQQHASTVHMSWSWANVLKAPFKRLESIFANES